MQPLRVALVGVGRRGTGVWLPVIGALRDRATLVAVGNRGAPRGKDAADSAGAPWFTDVETLLKEAQPQILVAAVNPPEIPNVSLPALEQGVSVITETPLAPTLEDADRMIEAAEKSGALLETAENFYRAPAERLKGAMIAEGVFGRVWRTFNDHRTHNYHAVSIIRSYIGFDVPVRRVTGWQQVFPTAEHRFRDRTVQEERARHAVLEFEGGALGFHAFSSLSLGSPIREGVRTTGFYAERGMSVGEELTLLTGEDSAETLRMERTMVEADGKEVLKEIRAGDWRWENPYAECGVPEGHVALASALDRMIAAVREGGQPEYGAWNGRVDREVDLAITRSQEMGNVPVELPL